MTEPGTLSTLDLILLAIGSPRRPADFGILLHFRKAPELEALRIGARSARNRYPATGSVVNGKRWTSIAVPNDGVTAAPFLAGATESFFDKPFDPRKQAPIQQLLLTTEPARQAVLATRIHHAAADGFSAAMWLRHQFHVPSGAEPLTFEPAPFEPVQLRRHRPGNRKNGFLRQARGLRLGNAASTGTRRWLTIELPAAFHGDALATGAIETLAEWNRIRGGGPRHIGLWLPVNIRRGRESGFGNGASSIRVYPHYSPSDSFARKCSEVQRQIRRGLRQREWAIPPDPWIARLPLWLSAPLLRLYLNRPWADVGTIPFSHARWNELEVNAFQDVERIECIGQLHKRHALALNAVTHHSRTWLTFTYDAGQMTSSEIRQLAEIYMGQVAMAERGVA